jgi:hypothetical protein
MLKFSFKSDLAKHVKVQLQVRAYIHTYYASKNFKSDLTKHKLFQLQVGLDKARAAGRGQSAEGADPVLVEVRVSIQ